MVPIGAQSHQLAKDVDADAPAHADHHRLALQGFDTLVEMLDDVPGDEFQARFGAYNGFELRPFGLELLPALDLLAFGGLFEFRVDGRFLALVQRKLGKSTLVETWNCRLVLYRALNVVDADVVAENRAGVGVLKLDGRSGETDERGVRQRIAHVARIAVDEIVLAAMRLVGDDDDVAPLRQQGVHVTPLFGEELLNCREHNAAHIDCEPGTQIRPGLRLHRHLPKKFLAACEGPEELGIEIVAVCQHHDGWVCHGWFPDDAPGIKSHGQALARALGVPNDAYAPIARRTARLPVWFVAVEFVDKTCSLSQLGRT